MGSKQEHIPSLDGLRALSFLLVFGSHAGLGKVIPGGFGVTVFFFLSGYLITTLMRKELLQTKAINLRHFYLRRAFRILPPFYLILLLAMGATQLGLLGQERLRLMPSLSQLLHFSNFYVSAYGWKGTAPGTGVYWSLAVEEHFYLVFPAFFILLNHLRLSGKQQAFTFWGICGAVLLWRCILVYHYHATFDNLYLRSDTRIDGIAFGCGLAVYRNPILDAEGWNKKPGLLLAAAIGLLLIAFVIRNEFFRDIFHYTLQGIALTPIFALAIKYPEWRIIQPLNWKPLRFLGALSYSLYLVHQVILYYLENSFPDLGGVATAGLGFLVSFGLAYVLYYAIEKPSARLRRKLSG